MPGGYLQIPDWLSIENQGGGVAVADVSGNGQRDLVVFMVDAPAGQNRGLYRIGRNLGATGAVTGGWTPWIDVPDWFSWDNQGVGIAVTDFTATGQSDLLVMMIDNADEQNQAFYKIGKNVDINGAVAGGWSLWQGVPAWFAWENQGGGIASIRRNGRPELLVMLIDNPPGQNGGWYRTLPLDTDPRRDGQWELLSFHSGVLAVHAALLPQGKVLFFAGSGSSALRFDSPDFGNLAKAIFMSVVWAPQAAPPNNFFHPNTIFAAGRMRRSLIRKASNGHL